ncbi:MAG TPA: gluconate 2-dehydrogenase subunit 3 family protein [Gemmatimonadaceae bacterium]
MNRREAIRASTAILGGVLITSNGFLVACSRERVEAASATGVLSADDQALIEEIADTLLPTTAASPGAKAAGAGAAINLLVTDCWEPEKQQKVVDGLKQFRQTSQTKGGGEFANLGVAKREALLRDIDAEAKGKGDAHYFNLVRDLSLQAYFSSEIGMTKARRWIMIPGKFVGCMPLKPGQPAWA